MFLSLKFKISDYESQSNIHYTYVHRFTLNVKKMCSYLYVVGLHVVVYTHGFHATLLTTQTLNKSLQVQRASVAIWTFVLTSRPGYLLFLLVGCRHNHKDERP